MTVTEHKSDFKLTKDTPYLALTGKLWVVLLWEFWRKLTMLQRDCTVFGIWQKTSQVKEPPIHHGTSNPCRQGIWLHMVLSGDYWCLGKLLYPDLWHSHMRSAHILGASDALRYNQKRGKWNSLFAPCNQHVGEKISHSNECWKTYRVFRNYTHGSHPFHPYPWFWCWFYHSNQSGPAHMLIFFIIIKINFPVIVLITIRLL